MEKLLLADLVDKVINQMQASGFAESTQKLYAQVYKRLIRLAEEKGEIYYSIELGQAFINDTSHIIPKNTERYLRADSIHERYLFSRPILQPAQEQCHFAGKDRHQKKRCHDAPLLR